MPLQETSGTASYDAFGGGAAVTPVYIEDVYSTFLYTGNGSTQTITNGIDLAGKGGLTWIKDRSAVRSHCLADTANGAYYNLFSDSTGALSGPDFQRLSAFNSNGFSVGSAGLVNNSGSTYASWTFRKQPKFFDVVTYTGNGSSQTIAHNLGSVPGCIIVKRTDAGASWAVYHRGVNAGVNPEQYFLVLSGIQAQASSSAFWNNTAPTSTQFTVGTNSAVNASGGTYVAYVFAHNAGGFGLTGTDNVISCGSFVGDVSGSTTVTLGYEPQWVLLKDASGSDNWFIVDNMRGWALTGNQELRPNLSNAESSRTLGYPTATGFVATTNFTAGNTYIYIAIRRGPMKTPTSGTSVFKAITRTGTGAAVTVSGAGFAPDLVATACRDFNGFGYYDKLRGALKALRPSQTSAEATYTTTLTGFTNDGYTAGSNSDGFGEINGNTDPYVNHMFARAPGFFDEVCYTGTGASSQTYNHNLGVAPELMIVKCRNTSPTDWAVYNSTIGATNYLWLNTTDQSQAFSTIWNNTAPTSSVFTVGSNGQTGASGRTYVAYLFASCPGVSKVGSYTGTGATQTISCGFAARFVMIKRTDSTGNWWVWDTARGMVAGTDPRLALNSTAIETNANWVYTDASGFQIVTTDATVNASGGSYIFLAVG